MLEKIGLPAKPSMRGNNWVVDASHCQGCSSQFSFINRKHHCRRCGGLFCNSCTNQRMILRGQGDSPVRICDPCKKLEEAARFELRHGHRNRTSRGGSKLTANSEDEVLNQILGTDIKQSSLSGSASTINNAFSNFEKSTSNASSSSFNEEAVTLSGDTQSDAAEEIGSCSPEQLVQLSLEEKQKYRTLKGEGKPEEALRAFKRGKELERQAKALEVALRKSNRKASSSNSLAGKTIEDSEGSLRKSKLSSHVNKEEKNDLASELRELGWADADLHDAEKNPVKKSLEGELSNLLGEVHKKSGIGKGTGSIDKTQVIALKKRALLLKREGKLSEAKEELKKAKVLEKQLEEQEFLAEAEDSDDELSSLIRSMDDDKQDDLFLMYRQDTDFEFNDIVGVSDDLGLDGNFEVTEDDMEDPEIAAALNSLGWTEELEHPVVPAVQPVPVDRKALLDEVLALKKEAVRQKRSGNVEVAMALLRKAKLLERDAESLESQGKNFKAPNTTTENVLTSQMAGNSPSRKVDDVMVGSSTYMEPKLPPKSKLTIQRELLALKKKALALKREGRMEEAEEELRNGKVLESQLEEMESGSRFRVTKVTASSKVSESVYKPPGVSGVEGLGEEDDEADVTDQDMQDPTMLKMLESLGWKDDNRQPENFPSRHSNLLDSLTKDAIDPQLPSTTGIAVMAPKRSKAEIQRELLGLKRKALTLRRQGEIEEAEEVLKKAKLLEVQMEEIEVSKKESLTEALGSMDSLRESETAKPSPKSSLEDVQRQSMPDPVLYSHVDNLGRRAEIVGSVDMSAKPSEHAAKLVEHVVDPFKIHAPSETPRLVPRSKPEIQRELLVLKRKALNLRRQGETEEAEEVLKMAKGLEEQIEEMTNPQKESLLNPTNDKDPDVGFFMSEEKSGDSTSIEEVTKGILELFVGSKDVVPELATGSHFNNNCLAIPPTSASISTPTMFQFIDVNTSLLELDHPAEIKVVECAGSFSQSGQSVNLGDLLTGDDWQSTQTPIQEEESKGTFSDGILSLDNLYAQSGTSKSSNQVTGSKDEFLSENAENLVTKVEKTPVHETDSTLFDSQKSPSDIRHTILVLKRKAVALKREGRLADAREELRQAKLLEKSLQEDKPQPDADSSDAFISTSAPPFLQEERKPEQQAPKPMTGRDRFKLQQESLAHKRQALKLRREGRTAEAEAEFELAKALESQLEDSSNKSTNEAGGVDDLGVEDLLDPQLLSALKAIGLQDAEIIPPAPVRPQVTKPHISKSDASSEEKSQLAERIKAEKVKAINLKKAGKQAEALDALRRAKLYEKKLSTLA